MNFIHPNIWTVQARGRLKLTGTHMNQALGFPVNFRGMWRCLQKEQSCPPSWRGYPFAYLERLWWPGHKLIAFWYWMRMLTCLVVTISLRNCILLPILLFAIVSSVSVLLELKQLLLLSLRVWTDIGFYTLGQGSPNKGPWIYSFPMTQIAV